MDSNEIATMEANVIACLKESLEDEAFSNLVKLVAVNRMTNGKTKLFEAQYFACLSYGYQFIKGPAYALQSEEHAETARNCLLSCASEPAESIGDAAMSRTLMLIILLTYYTLARSKLLLDRNKEAVKFALKAKSVLARLLSTDEENTEHTNLSTNEDGGQTGKEHTTCSSSYPDVASLLLRPGEGFFPSLNHLQIRLCTLMGRALANQRKLLSAEEHYTKALELTENLFGPNCTETIPIIQALSQIYERRPRVDAEETVVRLNEKLMEIARHNYVATPELRNLLQLMQIAHRLSTVYLSTNDPRLEDRAEQVILDVLQIRPATSSPMDSTDVTDVSNPMSARSNDDRLMSVSQQLVHSEAEARKHAERSMSEEQLKKQQIEASCALRSVLIRLRLSNKRYEDAEELLKTNLAVQQVTFGLYSPDAVVTQKMLLSCGLAQGGGKRCLIQARECLAMEEVTFGTKSKQASQTREIIKALIGAER